MTTTTEPTPAATLEADGKALLTTALGALKSAIGVIVTNTAAEIPTLTDDGIAVVSSAAENLVPATVRPLVTSVLGIFAKPEAAFAGAIDAKAIAMLQIGAANIDVALDKLG